MTTMTMPKPGERLSNGAIVVATKNSGNGNRHYVLALLGGLDWVTWRYYPETGECEAGHYFSTKFDVLDSAVEDLNYRASL